MRVRQKYSSIKFSNDETGAPISFQAVIKDWHKTKVKLNKYLNCGVSVHCGPVQVVAAARPTANAGLTDVATFEHCNTHTQSQIRPFFLVQGLKYTECVCVRYSIFVTAVPKGAVLFKWEMEITFTQARSHWLYHEAHTAAALQEGSRHATLPSSLCVQWWAYNTVNWPMYEVIKLPLHLPGPGINAIDWTPEKYLNGL